MKAWLRTFCVSVSLVLKILGHYKLVVGIGVFSKCWPFMVEISNACVIPSSAEIEKLERDINTLKEAGGELTI